MKVIFQINYYTVWGQNLYITGSIPELGSWETGLAKELHYAGNGEWQLELNVPAETSSIEYRYFLDANDTPLFEQWEKKHKIIFDGLSEEYVVYDHWQDRPDDQSFYTSAFTKSWFSHPCPEERNLNKLNRRMMIRVYAPRVEANQIVAITGNQSFLGHWDPEKALRLNCETFPEWSIIMDAAEITFPLEYKFLLWDNDTHTPVLWETGENRFWNSPLPGDGQTLVLSGLRFKEQLPPWRCAGTVIPVFSLRSEESFGVGDFGDLYKMIDWARKTQQRIIQILPINDTTMSHSWKDSYPYSAISIYALHPMFLCIPWLGPLKDTKKAEYYEEIRLELNKKDSVDYEHVSHYKLSYCREFFEQQGKEMLNTSAFHDFFDEHGHWLMPYAAYNFLRDNIGTPDFTHWGKDSVYNEFRIRKLCSRENEAWPEISFYYYMQYILHIQFKTVSEYAGKNGVVLKGDLPIGVNRTSIETWTEPEYFNMQSQSGAPPDDFSSLGQNWSFPTYNWSIMEKDHFRWWKRRFANLSDYFKCFRIDHILGFFRIWEIPFEYVQGLCGHFSPALPLSVEEIEQSGMNFDPYRFTTPHIHRRHLLHLFNDLADEVESAYLIQLDAEHLMLKPFCDTQRKIDGLFEARKDEEANLLRNGLWAIANEVLFLKDPKQKDKYHPRISASRSLIYQELSDADRQGFDRLYDDFFYHRHNEFWKHQAFNHLTPLIASTDMLVCGEDLGMIPESVPQVMNDLQILSLEIERMPKVANREFADLFHLPYLSVCTTSTHDMSPLRNWWKEDRGKTQRYYNAILQRPGAAPEECTSDLATQIISNHLSSTSMLTIIPIQDWFSTDDTVKRSDIETERINVPADPNHYWQYRMHISLEKLIENDAFNDKIRDLIVRSGRR